MSGQKSEKGLDDSSINGDEPIFNPSLAPRVHFSKLKKTTKSKLELRMKSITSLSF